MPKSPLNPAVQTLERHPALKSHLQCVGCKQMPNNGPIFQCLEGHLICQDCSETSKQCKSCNSDIINVRSIIAEQVMETLPKPCAFAADGCKLEAIPEELVEHEDECLFRKVCCPALPCPEMIVSKKIRAHMKQHHQDLKLTKFSSSVFFKEDLKEESFAIDHIVKPRHLRFEGFNFFTEVCRSQDLNLWYLWIYVNGTEAEANKFYFDVRISSENETETIFFEGRVVSIDIGPKDISRLSLAFEVSDTRMKQIAKSKKIKIGFRLRVGPRSSCTIA